jgi:uncharacterized membrane protein HdeD (DUF308 family)
VKRFGRLRYQRQGESTKWITRITFGNTEDGSWHAGAFRFVAGMAAIAYSVLATLISVIFLAALMIFAGVLEGAYAIRHRERGHLTLYLLEALLAFVIGVLLLRSLVSGAVVLTMLVAAYFVVSGIFRVVGALALRLPHWGWLLTSGLINLGLGIIVWGGWPVTGLWVLGMFIGINLLFSGWARVMLALALRSHRLEPLTI